MENKSNIEYIRAEENAQPEKIWKFSVLDRACLPMVIRGTWVFGGELDIDVLKSGFKKLLKYYPYLSGRMLTSNEISFTNDGVPFLITENLGLSIEDIKREDKFINDFSIKINPAKIKKGLEAPLSIKITKLKDGYVLGMQCSHALMDGDSFYTMVYNWGQICRAKDFEKPVLDQSLFSIPENISKDKLMQEAIDNGWKKLSISALIKLLPMVVSGSLKGRSDPFCISAEGIDKLKKEIAGDDKFSCSSNVALCALISKMSAKLYGHDNETECSQVTVIDVRDRVAGIPPNFTGNASTTISTPYFSAGLSVKEIAKIIKRTLEPFVENPSKELERILSLNINVMHSKLPLAPFDVMAMNSKKPRVFYINNFSKLHIYDVDFGFGKAILVIPHNLSDQVIIWPASPEKGGVEIYFSGIPNHIIKKLGKDDPWLREMGEYK